MQTAETVFEIGTLKAKHAFTHKDMFTTKENADIQFSSTLYSGKPAKGMRGTIVVELLERTNRMRLPLPFEFGDVEGLSEKDKDILFQYDLCDPAESPLLQKSIATIFTGSFTSDDFGLIKPKLPILKPGTYRARFIADNETIPFTLESTWSVIDPDAKNMSLDEHILLYANKTSCEPNDTAIITIGSAWKDASILMQIESRGKIIKQERITLSASMKQILIPITNAYRGGIAIHVSLAKYNRLITKSMSLTVPWSNAKIAIKTSSLRDKTSPGNKEIFSFSIDAKNKEHEVMGIVYDASLDALAPRQYHGIYNLWEPMYPQAQPIGLTTNTSYAASLFGNRWNEAGNGLSMLREFDEFNVDLLLGGIYGRTEVIYYDQMVMATNMMSAPSPILRGMKAARGMKESAELPETSTSITPRIAMQETAFFAPAITVLNGIASIETTMPDALTRWNIRLFAHGKEMSFGSLDTSIISQKEFMIQSNIPRFVRHGDTITLRSSIYVLNAEAILKGKANLSYFTDDDSLHVKTLSTDFSASKSTPGQVMWNLIIPKGRTITLTYSGESGSFQDAERYTIPILPSMLPITERYPIWLNPEKSKSKSITLKEAKDIQSLSIQTSSEPYWYALEALPDLLDKSYGSSIDHLHRMLASLFAERYILSNPAIKEVLKDSLLKGRISQNIDAQKGISKSDIGPWESSMIQQDTQAGNLSIYAQPEKIKRIGVMAFDELQKMQLSSGAFPWFPSMSESKYFTRQILIGFGIAESISSIRSNNRDALFLIDRMIEWLDDTFMKEIEQALKLQSKDDTFRLAFSDIHHLYARSFFTKSHPLPKSEGMSLLMQSLWKERMKHGLQGEAMIALILHHMGEQDKSLAMLRSLKERSLNDMGGIHWPIKSTSWNDADIETHALLLNAFNEIQPDASIRAGIITYLLQQKQTRNWGTSSATFSAVMSLLKQAESCKNSTISVTIDGKSTNQKSSGFPGLSQFTISDAKEIKTIEATTNTECPAWGGVYRHRMIPLSEEFSDADTTFQITREYFRRIPGKGLLPIKNDDPVHMGERIVIRIRVFAPQAMNYVQVQDLFPACFDIMANNSEYRHYQNLWYYIIPRDKAMNFFIDYLPKGMSIIEYEVKIDKTGRFSKGMIQAYSIYAPEFGATNGGGIIISSP
jgi:hypothetical protein